MEVDVTYFKEHTGILVEGLRKTTKRLSEDGRPLHQDFNPRSQEYREGGLTTINQRYIILKPGYKLPDVKVVPVLYC
jgi:hypothetical protein